MNYVKMGEKKHLLNADMNIPAGGGVYHHRTKEMK